MKNFLFCLGFMIVGLISLNAVEKKKNFYLEDVEELNDGIEVSFNYITRIVTITVDSGYYYDGWVEVCNGNATSLHSCIEKQFSPTFSGGTFTVKAPSRSTSTDTGVVVHTGGFSWAFPY